MIMVLFPSEFRYIYVNQYFDCTIRMYVQMQMSCTKLRIIPYLCSFWSSDNYIHKKFEATNSD